MNSRNNARDVLLYLLTLFKDYYPYLIAALAVAFILLLNLPDIVLMIAGGVSAVALLVYYRYTDSKKLKMRAYETMSPELKSEIDEERRINIKKRQQFLDAMDRASGGSGGGKNV